MEGLSELAKLMSNLTVCE